MPKKTKKEKLLAQRHRWSHISSVATQPKTVYPDNPVHAASAFSLSLPLQNKAYQPANVTSINEFQTMKKDVLKTIIITTIILTSEFLLAHTLLNR